MRFWIICVSIACSVVGLFLLFLLKPDVSPQSLVLTGEVVAVKNYPNVNFVEFIPDNLTVVSFDNPPAVGRQVIHGQLKQYKGKVEFIIDN